LNFNASLVLFEAVAKIPGHFLQTGQLFTNCCYQWYNIIVQKSIAVHRMTYAF